jgi:hypothetical protein
VLVWTASKGSFDIAELNPHCDVVEQWVGAAGSDALIAPVGDGCAGRCRSVPVGAGR